MASKKGANGSGFMLSAGPPAISSGQTRWSPSSGFVSGPRWPEIILTLRGQRRNAGLPQHRRDVEVVHLKRDGERPDFEHSRRHPRFQAERRRARSQRLLIPEDAFAHHIGPAVPGAIKDLQRQAGHAHGVAIRIGQRHRELAPVILVNRARLAAQNRLRRLNLLPRTQNQCLSLSVVSRQSSVPSASSFQSTATDRSNAVSGRSIPAARFSSRPAR